MKTEFGKRPPHGANNMVLHGNHFCFHSVVGCREEVWEKLYRNKTEKKKKKRNETETPTVGLACLALSEWHSNIGLMNEWTPFCQVKGSIEYHLLLYYISSGCLVIKLPWLFSVIFSLNLYSDLEERRWRQLISGGKAVANGDVKTV